MESLSVRVRVQIVAMSATVAPESATKLAAWLHACLFTTSFRPVPLSMHLKVGACARYLGLLSVSRALCLILTL